MLINVFRSVTHDVFYTKMQQHQWKPKQQWTLLIPLKLIKKPYLKFSLCACTSLFVCNLFSKRKQLHAARHIPIQEGRGLSQALLSPVIHFRVEAPCRVYPGSHLYVMLLPEKWPWSLTLKPNWGTPGSSQWDNSKPGERKKKILTVCTLERKLTTENLTLPGEKQN